MPGPAVEAGAADPPPTRVYIDDCISSERWDAVEQSMVTRTGWVVKTHEQAGGSDDADDLMTGDSDADADALAELMNDPLRAPVDAGEARVQWIDSIDLEVVSTSGLTVVDRPHLLGDIVARATDPGGESGMICEVQTSANVRFVVSGAEIEGHRSLELGSKVCEADVAVHGSMNWAGFVRGAVFSVVLMTESGFVFMFPSISSQEAPQFIGLNEEEDPGLCPHFPGQQVLVKRDTLRNAACIQGSKEFPDGMIPNDKDDFEMVVKSVQLEEVVVDWATRGPGGSKHPPAMIMPVDQLEWLPLSDKGYRVGDYARMFDVEGLGPWSDDADRIARITSTVTQCRVLWATSGHMEDRWIPSKELVPRPPTLAKDFGPLSYVAVTSDYIKDALDQLKSKLGRRLTKTETKKIKAKQYDVGLVHAVDEGAQQCSVYWIEPDKLARIPRDDPGQEGLYGETAGDGELKTEIMETYDVQPYPFGFVPGDIVVRKACACELKPAHEGGRAAKAEQDPQNGAADPSYIEGARAADGDDATSELGNSASRDVSPDGMSIETTSPVSRNWIGQILGIGRTGLVRVHWHGGDTTMEFPMNLELVDNKDYESEEYEDDIIDYEELEDGDAWPFSEGDEEWTDVDDDDSIHSEENTPEDTMMEDRDAEVPLQGGEAGAAEDGAACDAEDEIEDSYAPFEILDSAPDDHAFKPEHTTSISPKVIAKEMKTLIKGLPQDGSIAIRGYEDRSDLCRAVVFGPPGTPYEGIPFFFDIFLPADYPKVPPKMLYWAGTSQDRLNPNLYENGKVCLSLLGTWNGPGWDPKTSSILQLLLSVQALVLVEEPYYNEPGFEKLKGTAEGTRASKLYSENSFILSVQNFLAHWAQPPSGFKAVLRTYYKGERNEGQGLLKRCRGLVVAAEDVRSAGFARLLEKRIIPKLEALFSGKS